MSTPDEQTRIVSRGNFELPCDPSVALALFTPEGERRWVRGWDPSYRTEATDEEGAVWQTTLGGDTTWVTSDRSSDRVRYAFRRCRHCWARRGGVQSQQRWHEG